jgi:hypothetical protein
MFQAGTDQVLDDQLQRPRAPVPTAPGFSFMDLVASPFQGIGGAAAKTLAFGSEITGAFGQVAGAYPEALGPITLSDEQKKQAEAQRRKLLTTGIDYSNEAGDIFRQRARDIMPDPLTTHASAQIVAGLTDFMTQAVGYTATMGPAGAMLLGADVGMSESDRLKQQGVDLATRTKAGAVAGAVAGGSVIMPMSGATALSRFAKGAAVGEASMIGQSAAEKVILEHAGYDKIANTFDPLDPVALAMGLVPGALGAKFGKPRAPVPLRTEADMRAAAVLEPDRAALEAQQESSASNLRELEQAIAAEKDPKNKVVLQGLLDHQRSVAAEVASNPDYVHAARVQQAATALERSRLTPADDLAGAEAHVRAVETAMDQIGRGEPVRVTNILAPDFSALADAHNQAQALAAERESLLPVAGGLAERGAIRQAREEPRLMEQRRPDNSDAAYRDVAKDIQGRDGVSYKAALSRAKKDIDGQMADFEARQQRLQDAIEANARAQQANQRIGEIDGLLPDLERQAAPYRTALAAEALRAAREPVEAVTPGLSAEPAPSRATPVAEAARTAMDEHQAAGKTIAQFLTDNPQHPPEVRNLLIGMDKAKDDAGRARLLQDFENMARRDQTAPLMDVAADAVEGQRSKAPEQSAVDAAAAQVEAMNPDMLVQLDGMDGPMRVSDLMKRIREEAATDAEEAQLIQAAAECALRY